MKFNTPYEREISPGKVMDKTRKVCDIGYIPADRMIKEMMEAGQRLASIRQEAYEFADEEEVPDGYISPLNVRGADIISVSDAARGLSARFEEAKAAKAAADKKAAIEAREAEKAAEREAIRKEIEGGK